MNWHKTSVALIVILALIDIFLAIMLHGAYKEARFIPEKLVSEARENLETRGITFGDGAIDKAKYSRSVYRYSTELVFAEELKENARQTHPALLKIITQLTNISEKDISECVQFFDIPDGTSVSVFNKKGESEASAVITGDMKFEFCSANTDKDDISDCVSKLLSKDIANNVRSYDPPAAVKTLFEKVYGDVISASAVASEETDNGTAVLCRLRADGSDIYGSKVCFYIEKGKILYIEGDIFFNTPETEYSAEIIDGINILYSIPKYFDGAFEIVSEKPAYIMISYNEKEKYIVPSWLIEFDSDGALHIGGEGGKETEFLLFNALNGEIHR